MAEKVVIGDATLYLGRCEDVLPEVEFGALVVDPPYGMGYKSNHNSGRKRECWHGSQRW